VPQHVGQGQAHQPGGRAEDDRLVHGRARAGEGPAQDHGGQHGRLCGHVPAQVVHGFGLHFGVRGDEGRDGSDDRPQQRREDADDRHADGHDAVAHPLGLVPAVLPQVVADEDGGREVEGHGREEEHCLDADAGAHAGHGHDAAFGEARGDGVEDHVGRVPDQLHEPGRPGDLDQVGQGQARPAPGCEALGAEQAAAVQHDDVVDRAADDGAEGGPGDALVPEFGQAPQAQAQAQVAQGVHARDQDHRIQRQGHDLLGPEEGVGDREDVVGRHEVQADLKQVLCDGHELRRDLQQVQEALVEPQSEDQDGQARDHAQAHAQAHEALDALRQPGPGALTDGGHAAVGQGDGHDHEEEHGLAHDAHAGLGLAADAAGHPDVHEADQEVEKHHDHLGPGQVPDGRIGGALHAPVEIAHVFSGCCM